MFKKTHEKYKHRKQCHYLCNQSSIKNKCIEGGGGLSMIGTIDMKWDEATEDPGVH